VQKLSRPLRRSAVVLEHAAQSFPTLDRTFAAKVLAARIDQFVAEPLVIALAMVVLGVRADGVVCENSADEKVEGVR
jgi:hypothetical protein